MMLTFALATLWHERGRYLPGVVAVAFTVVLTALQGGLLLGMFAFVSLPIDRARADVWMGGPDIRTADMSQPIPAHDLDLLASQPEIDRCETYVQGMAPFTRPDGTVELCMVLGANLQPDSLGAVHDLTPQHRALLTEPGTIVIDQGDVSRLGLKGVGDYGELAGRRVRLVGLVHGFQGIAGVYIFCSVPTARRLLRLSENQATYVLGRCRNPAAAEAVADRLRGQTKLSVFSRDDLSLRSRNHWLTKTRAGVSMSCGTLLGFLIGVLITGQTLYAATAVSLRQYAVLRAMGIPRRRMATAVLYQAGGVGSAGVLLGLGLIPLCAWVLHGLGAQLLLPGWLLVLSSVLTLLMALFSGVAALRLLWRVEPTSLLR
jgi:putative ABC transport system permease protein